MKDGNSNNSTQYYTSTHHTQMFLILNRFGIPNQLYNLTTNTVSINAGVLLIRTLYIESNKHSIIGSVVLLKGIVLSDKVMKVLLL